MTTNTFDLIWSDNACDRTWVPPKVILSSVQLIPNLTENLDDQVTVALSSLVEIKLNQVVTVMQTLNTWPMKQMLNRYHSIKQYFGSHSSVIFVLIYFLVLVLVLVF